MISRSALVEIREMSAEECKHLFSRGTPLILSTSADTDINGPSQPSSYTKSGSIGSTDIWLRPTGKTCEAWTSMLQLPLQNDSVPDRRPSLFHASLGRLSSLVCFRLLLGREHRGLYFEPRLCYWQMYNRQCRPSLVVDTSNTPDSHLASSKTCGLYSHPRDAGLINEAVKRDIRTVKQSFTSWKSHRTVSLEMLDNSLAFDLQRSLHYARLSKFIPCECF